MKESQITLKLPYYTEDGDLSVIFSFIKQYNNLLRFTYNRFKDNDKLKTKEITDLQKQMNNIDLMDQYFKTGSVYDAKSLLENDKLIFGGKKLFLERCKNKISKDEFKFKRLRPLQIVGASFNKGNCKFSILNTHQILFKPNRENHIVLNLRSIGKKNSKLLNRLIELQNSCQIALTYKLDLNYIYLSFDYSKVKQNIYNTKQNRVFGIDLNPNYIGYSIVDWKNEHNYSIVDKGVFELIELNKQTTNKKDYEIIQLAYKLFKLCKHYKCECFAVEDLYIKTKDLKKGKKLNKLVNNDWNRNRLVNILRKLVNSSSTNLLEVKPEYSSILGNLIYRKEELPDMILSSIEIGRRGIEFQNQYLLNRKERKKNIVLPDFNLVKERISKSLEELNIFSQIKNYEELFSVLKKSKQQYRFLLSFVKKERVFRSFYYKSKIILYNII